VNGRQTAVLEAMPRGHDQALGVHRLWVDREDNLPVRVELNRADGETFFELTFVEFERDVMIPAEQFTFDPPTGVTVERMDAGDWAERLGWQSVSLEEAREAADFPILIPTMLPDGLEQRYVLLGTAGEQQLVAIVYQEFSIDHTILVQSHRDASLEGHSYGEPVQINGQQGNLVALWDANILTWMEGETRLSLITQFPRQEALDFAGTLSQ
jgi:uncharacterized DUF497 family protein